jgi:hypothetical protein
MLGFSKPFIGFIVPENRLKSAVCCLNSLSFAGFIADSCIGHVFQVANLSGAVSPAFDVKVTVASCFASFACSSKNWAAVPAVIPIRLFYPVKHPLTPRGLFLLNLRPGFLNFLVPPLFSCS